MTKKLQNIGAQVYAYLKLTFSAGWKVFGFVTGKLINAADGAH